MNIVLIDDDEDEHQLFTEALKSINAEANLSHAHNGRIGLNLLEEMSAAPDYIFLDINMPVMGGRETLQNIKSHSKLRDVPIIIYSTSNNPLEIDFFNKMGIVHFMVKPDSYVTLVKNLKDLLNEHQQ
jgi:CheY-like chemotaxis protein